MMRNFFIDNRGFPWQATRSTQGSQTTFNDFMDLTIKYSTCWTAGVKGPNETSKGCRSSLCGQPLNISACHKGRPTRPAADFQGVSIIICPRAQAAPPACVHTHINNILGKRPKPEEAISHKLGPAAPTNVSPCLPNPRAATRAVGTVGD